MNEIPAKISLSDAMRRVDEPPVFHTNTPRPGDVPGSRDRPKLPINTATPMPASPPVLADGKATKKDGGKVMLHLLPFDALAAVADVLTWACSPHDGKDAKYAARDWERGCDWSRYFRASLSHLWAHWMGEKYDKETGKLHLAHAAACVLIILTYQLRAIGNDDRPII